MTHIAKYPGHGDNWGIKLNDGSWMTCIDKNLDWHQSREICREILDQARAWDTTKKPPLPKDKPPTEAAMHRYRSGNARQAKAVRSIRRNNR